MTVGARRVEWKGRAHQLAEMWAAQEDVPWDACADGYLTFPRKSVERALERS
jgi:hypothetical protein